MQLIVKFANDDEAAALDYETNRQHVVYVFNKLPHGARHKAAMRLGWSRCHVTNLLNGHTHDASALDALAVWAWEETDRLAAANRLRGEMLREQERLMRL